MSRIDKLTAEQEALIPVVRDEWLAHGLSTVAADRDEAVRGVATAYAEAGLAAPAIVVWLDSPLAGAIGSWMLDQVLGQVGVQVGNQVWDQVGGQVLGQVGDQVRNQVWGQVGDQVGNQVWGQVGVQVGDQVWDQVGGQVLGQVGDQVRDQVGGQVWDQVGGQVLGQVGDQVRDQVWGKVGLAIFGQYGAGYLSFYDYFRRACNLTVCQRMDGLNAVARNGGWWWAYRGAVVLTDRPAQLHRDPQTRLHHPSGPAIAYRDGWSVWAWHGVRVPQDLIEGRWSTQDILRHGNAEVRRCAIEHMGWGRFVHEAGLRQVGETVPDPGNPGHYLALYDVPEQIYDEPIRVLLCENATPERDGTRRRFGLTVPTDMPDPLTAAAWTFALDPETYRQLTHAY